MRVSRDHIQTLISCAVLLAVFVLVWSVFLRPVFAYKSHLKAEIGSLQATNEQLQNSISNLKAITENRSEEAVSGIAWQGNSKGEVSAKIQSRLSELLRGNGVSLRSITPQISGTETGAAIRLSVELEGPLDHVVAALRDIENNMPPLIVGKAGFRRVQTLTSGTSQPSVSVQLTISAIIEAEE